MLCLTDVVVVVTGRIWWSLWRQQPGDEESELPGEGKQRSEKG